MKTKIEGGPKAPRTHDPKWKDTTSTARGQSLTEKDNAWAAMVSNGKYTTLRTLMTAIRRGEKFGTLI
jgi:hypothetical protein